MAQPPRLASRPSSMLPTTTPGLGVGLQPAAASALSRNIPTPRLYELKNTPVSLTTQHGQLHFQYPTRLIEQVFCNSLLWMDVYQDCGFTFQVDPVIDRAGCPRSIMKCGAFTSLDAANRAVLQVFSEDSRELMIDRYRTMVFREMDEVPSSGRWTGYCYGVEQPTLRLWATQGEQWSFRVEAVLSANQRAS
ncbi:hypothetical protein JX266_014214 [Neoarthrinium moseri]|nr:hypothetical protein JX266_014214 [Neoarthrinium moseri]